MRLIGHVSDEKNATTFGDYLLVRGVANRVEEDAGHGWAVWVMDEDKLGEASGLLEDFRANPADPRFRSESKSAAKIRDQQQKEQEAWEKKLMQRRHLFKPLRDYPFGPLTFLLIVASVVVFVISGFADHVDRIGGLFISEVRGRSLPEVRSGEVWRLFTPMFIHLGWLHIIFNMMWLRELGSMVEARQSTGLLAAFALVVSAASNLAQYYIDGPGFGGMSGVVYGLLGYIWIRGKMDPGSGLFVNQPTVIMMFAWMALGFAGLFHMANWAHLGGLLMGVLWGYLGSWRYR